MSFYEVIQQESGNPIVEESYMQGPLTFEHNNDHYETVKR